MNLKATRKWFSSTAIQTLQRKDLTSNLKEEAGLHSNFHRSPLLTFGRLGWSRGGQRPPPSGMDTSWVRAQGLLLAISQSAQSVSQSRFQQLDFILLQLQLLLQVGNTVLHVHVTAGWHRVIWTGESCYSFMYVSLTLVWTTWKRFTYNQYTILQHYDLATCWNCI